MAACASCGAVLPSDARFCPACAAPVEARAPAEERKLATVLFADLVGSTRLGHEQQDPERTRLLLDRFYAAMAGEVEAAGGTLEKFIGDAVMAAFGAPTAQEDHAERALHAALAMQRRMGELFGDGLRLRIGVNTGEVVVGRAPDGGSLVTTGDAVNVSARLEQAAESGEILVGERTVAAVRGAFEFTEPEIVEAKGKPEGVRCRRLLRALSLMRPRGSGGLRGVFVGREAELEQLRATFRRVVERRQPHVVTIVGDAGVGKSSLVRELWQWLAVESPQPVQRTGRCLSYGKLTYWPLADVLREHLGLLASDPPELVLERLGKREALGLAFGLDVAEDLHPLVARDHLHESCIDFLSEIAAERPLVVLIEDVHWAEEPLLELLERMVRDVRGPLLLVVTARLELLEHWSWSARASVSQIVLEPLDEEDAQRLVAHLPPRLRAVVLERAEGNPFFVEELVETMIDRGVLVAENGGWALREPPADFAVPDTVQAVLAARIDLLEAAEKAALQAGAVIGRVFWSSPVYELVEGLSPDLRVLEERDLIRRRPSSSIPGETEYAIKHALTREVAYASLPKARRARLHAAFAGWIERSGDGLDELAPLLAHHYAEAVRPEDADLAWADEEDEAARLRAQAVVWLRRAAGGLVRRYEIDEALSLLHRALELESSHEAQADLWRDVGTANALKYDGEAFWTAMLSSLEVCVDRRTCAQTYSELSFETAGRASMWRRRPDAELVRGWIEHALELAEPGSRARAKALVARALLDPLRESAAAREASALAEQLDDVELRSFALDARSRTAFANGQEHEACGWSERRLDLLDKISDPDHLADIYWSLVWPYVARCRFGDARRMAELHDEVGSQLTPHHRLHAVALLLAVEEYAGGWERAHDLAPRAERAVAANVATPCVHNVRSLLVSALAHLNLRDESGADRLEQEADALGMEGYENQLNGTRISIALAREDLEGVERLVAGIPPEALNLRDVAAWAGRLSGLTVLRDRERIEAEAPPLVRSHTYLEPFALRALGVVREDGTLIEQALTRFEDMGLDWHAEQTRALL